MVTAPVQDAPAPMSAPPRRRTPSVWVAGLVVVTAATVFRAWAIGPAWFFYDDLYFIQQARREGLTWAYLVQPYNGHLMPASWLLTWVNARAGAFDFRFPAVELVALAGLFGLGTLRLHLRLFGQRWAVVVLVALTLFSPILLPATTWWAAGVNQLPMLVALTFGLTDFVAHLQERRTRHLVASLLWVLVGLAFVERTLVVVPVMWLLALLFFATGTVPERVVHLWRHYRSALTSYAVLTVAYLAVYVPHAQNFETQQVASRPFFGVLGQLAGVAFPSGTTGGPLRWRVSDITQSEADPPQLVLVLSWVVLGVLVLASVRTRRRGARAWLIPLTSLVLNALLVAVSRAIFFGAEISLDFRFQTEVAVLMPLAVGLAFLPAPGAAESSEPRDSGWRIDTASTVVPALAVFLVAATVSASSFPLRHLTTTSPRRYVETFEASARADPGRQVLDTTVPTYVWSPLAYPTNLTSRMLGPLAGLVDFRVHTTDTAWRVDETGALVPVEVTEARAQEAATDARGCFATVRDDDLRVALDGPVLGAQWYVRLAYQATGPGALTLGTGDAEQTVRLAPGRHYVLAPAGGAYDEVVLSASEDSGPVCLRHLGIVAVDGLDRLTPS
ncbi:hypothetical protein G5V58_07515 [Nocardioides anomalus]|uniref:Glycosyltransferase RgtA/B/C/D-like domain-containing protein n=1 Tax=Nocardioides anomalus TaxID=2712223 RepID=A0A6G6WC17_9ACTN|nr:hypothetical protein [Nocardioides anomalus]QIG42645.1 hypothetical protein G5V58_07515 [Nocardioides anomalus]